MAYHCANFFAKHGALHSCRSEYALLIQHGVREVGRREWLNIFNLSRTAGTRVELIERLFVRNPQSLGGEEQ